MEPIPKLVFIVPYRDREQQRIFFANHMKTVLSDMNPDDYKIYYIHQCDTRAFNRGAMKNIGFMMVKAKYPADYQNITLVMNDVDTMPYTKGFLNYDTVFGNVKHFYGFEYTLGGIVSIKAADFEKINGFPNLWAWGYEDNLLQHRVEKAGFTIDRSQFYPFMDKNIMQMKDDLIRSVNRTDFDKYRTNTPEGIDSITDLVYTINEDTGFVDVTQFNTGREENPYTTKLFDLRTGAQPYPMDQKSAKSRAFGDVFNGTTIRKPAMGMISDNKPARPSMTSLPATRRGQRPMFSMNI
jgi:N-terminal region of glycosyl transferase group 7